MTMPDSTFDPWFAAHLVCPRHRLPLRQENDLLACPAGDNFPIVDGVPVLLLDDVQQTLAVAQASIKRARGDGQATDSRVPELHLESLGIGEAEKTRLVQDYNSQSATGVDPVVSHLVAATNGNLYKNLQGRLSTYPIPELPLARSNGGFLLDLGCNWGRWSIAASRKGYLAVGLDPSLGAVLAARRVARQLNLPIRYLVADARYLPFPNALFDNVFSYSVLQHFSEENAARVISEVGRVMQGGGTSLIQMANWLGLRSLHVQAKRRFRTPDDFDVRYWSISSLLRVFNKEIGSSEILADCYFGLGLQASDAPLLSPAKRALIGTSEFLRSLGKALPFLKYVADSVYVRSVRRAG